MFDKDAPHSGLANYSSRHFRMSMDIRLMRASARLPMTGTVTAVDEKAITVVGVDGKSECFGYDAATFCSSLVSARATCREDIPKLAV